MIKLATVFSGIGAIEHALKRMNIDHEIVFACDNGDVDILSKKIEANIIEIDKEIHELDSFIEELKNDETQSDEYIEKLSSDLEDVKNTYEELKNKIDVEDDLLTVIVPLIKSTFEKKYLNASTIKVYNKWLENWNVENNIDVNFSNKIELVKQIIKIENDYKRLDNEEFSIDKLINDNDLKQIYKKEVDITEFKCLVKVLNSVVDKLSMLHEKINTSYILKNLSKIKDYDEKKKYVDKLYEKQESSNNVKKSYLANYNMDKNHFHWNASFLDGNQYKNQVDLFVGGSPCQSFSLVGKQRGLNDTRGTLFYEYARLVQEVKPKVFIYENVKAVLSNDNGETWNTMTKVFDDLGYDWSYSILNAKDYGVPQNRERVFVVGFRKDLKVKSFNFPEKVELKSTMKDYLIDNVSGKYYLANKGVDFVTSEKNLNKRYTQIDGDIQLCQKKNQQFNWHGDFVFVEENKDMEKTIEDLDKYFLSEKVKKYVLSTGTKGFYSKPEIDLDIARPLLTSMHKMHRAGVDNYVTSEGRLRKLTPRECLRLMGFCDSFEIVVSDTSAYQQAGNSIVVDVLMAIMDSICKALGEEE